MTYKHFLLSALLLHTIVTHCSQNTEYKNLQLLKEFFSQKNEELSQLSQNICKQFNLVTSLDIKITKQREELFTKLEFDEKEIHDFVQKFKNLADTIDFEATTDIKFFLDKELFYNINVHANKKMINLNDIEEFKSGITILLVENALLIKLSKKYSECLEKLCDFMVLISHISDEKIRPKITKILIKTGKQITQTLKLLNDTFKLKEFGETVQIFKESYQKLKQSYYVNTYFKEHGIDLGTIFFIGTGIGCILAIIPLVSIYMS